MGIELYEQPAIQLAGCQELTPLEQVEQSILKLCGMYVFQSYRTHAHTDIYTLLAISIPTPAARCMHECSDYY
jgi:hypothetical protein